MDHQHAAEHVKYRVANAPVCEYPFPHFFIEDIFPTDYFSQIIKNWPGTDRFISIADTNRTSGDSYRERHIVNLPKIREEQSWEGKEFWEEVSSWFLGDNFLTFIVERYLPWIKGGRELAESIDVSADGLLVQDHTGYEIGPHTDAPHRLVSTLFYCPEDDSTAELGTSIYVPNSDEVETKISPKHHGRHLFDKVYTAPYIPNSLFGFVVSPNSFHGVDKVTSRNVQRKAILHFAKLNQQ